MEKNNCNKNNGRNVFWLNMNQKNYKSGRAQYFKNNVFLPGKILENY